MKKRKVTPLAIVLMLISTAAVAGITQGIQTNSGDKVYLEGKIIEITGENEFIVKDYMYGKEVEIVYDGKTYPIQSNGKSLDIIKGETVSVKGELDTGIFGSQIVADRVEYISVI